ncbi:MAG: nucleotide exchange factor GrpE [Planctomycetota bacterium]|nr:nucleotide exchange factor GrpE [Planctomycetota bacterium]MDP6503646.1 nucleotide exchange factor GrpE [Planctomycetota bacterium]
MSEETTKRLIAIIDLLGECVNSGERLLSLETKPTLRERIAATVLGEGASDNADDAAIMLHNAASSLQALVSLLEDEGVKQIEAHGKTYDSASHEAVDFVANENMRGKVIDVLKPGYEKNGKVIRRAQVRMGR